MNFPGPFKIPRLPRLARRTLPLQLVLNAATAPYFAMTQYALFLAVKTFHMSDVWVSVLYAAGNAAHLTAILVADRVQRSSKVAWITWPNLAAFGLLLLLWRIQPGMGVFFAVVLIVSQLLRGPIYMAQAVLYRTNFPPTVRSWAMSVNLAIYMLATAAFSWAAGPLLERSDAWIGPVFVLTGVIGIVGTVYFNRLRRIKNGDGVQSLPPPGRRISIRQQLALLRHDRGFRDFEIAYFFFGLGNVMMITVFPIYLKQEFNASHNQAMDAINVIPMFTSVVLLPVWGVLLDRRNPLVIRTWLMAIWGLTPAIFAFTHTMAGVYWASFVLGLVQGGGTLIWYLGINYYARAHNVALYMGVHQMLTGARCLIGPLLAVPIGRWMGYRQSMLAWVALMAIGSLIMWCEVRREKRLGVLRSFEEQEATEREEAACLID